MKDLNDPDKGISAFADQIRSTIFEEFCEDVVTRLKYKEMSLSPDEKYVLIEMFRGFKKTGVDFPKTINKLVGMDFYEKRVWAQLKAVGWLS